jgi:hypothetical protein
MQVLSYPERANSLFSASAVENQRDSDYQKKESLVPGISVPAHASLTPGGRVSIFTRIAHVR